MESKKRRMLDAGVIRGKGDGREEKRGESATGEKRKKAGGRKTTSLPRNEVAMNLPRRFSPTHAADWCLL